MGSGKGGGSSPKHQEIASLDNVRWAVSSDEVLNTMYTSPNNEPLYYKQDCNLYKKNPDRLLISAITVPDYAIKFENGIPVKLNQHNPITELLKLKDHFGDYKNMPPQSVLPRDFYKPVAVYTLNDTKFWSDYKDPKKIKEKILEIETSGQEMTRPDNLWENMKAFFGSKTSVITKRNNITKQISEYNL